MALGLDAAFSTCGGKVTWPRCVPGPRRQPGRRPCPPCRLPDPAQIASPECGHPSSQTPQPVSRVDESPLWATGPTVLVRVCSTIPGSLCKTLRNVKNCYVIPEVPPEKKNQVRCFMKRLSCWIKPILKLFTQNVLLFWDDTFLIVSLGFQ
ncbi:hypothetical protein E5288_WYG005103 [Bos mutus]|uniref:Uncharacterized protein n=1 Tax=Bos mutus TaxID=72004 RepID=A0A6B0S4Q0_9CETA|nr:hypothetical protein [Bos mutus]